jgi:hypothetical protein
LKAPITWGSQDEQTPTTFHNAYGEKVECLNDQAFAGLLVKKDPNGAWAAFTALSFPVDETKLARDKLKGAIVVPWAERQAALAKAATAIVKRNDYPALPVGTGLLRLLRCYAGTPFGLTWNGGIAYTLRDYLYVENSVKEKNRDERNTTPPEGDPVNPSGHLLPLLGPTWATAR